MSYRVLIATDDGDYIEYSDISKVSSEIIGDDIWLCLTWTDGSYSQFKLSAVNWYDVIVQNDTLIDIDNDNNKFKFDDCACGSNCKCKSGCGCNK